jgi:hypothetical protein
LSARILPSQDPSLIQLSGKGTLPEGAILSGSSLKSDKGLFFIRIGEAIFTSKVPLPENFQVKVMSSSPPIISLVKNDIFDRTDIKGMLAALAGKDPSALAADMGAKALSSLTPGELRRLFRDSGLFLENKLSKDISPVGDSKYIARENPTVFDGITRMQLAGVLLQEFFSFFDSDDLMEDAVVRVRKEENGVAVFVRLNFTRLGETILAVRPAPANAGYNALVHTKEDISAELASLAIEGLKIRWVRLTPKHSEDFNISGRVLTKLGRFDIRA